VDAVIKSLNLERPILSGWSYGGVVICDYLRQGRNLADYVLVGRYTDKNQIEYAWAQPATTEEELQRQYQEARKSGKAGLRNLTFVN
jgi:pimeloyl-ACP methyl ester carboxylesterase